jgi:hypothetical protein
MRRLSLALAMALCIGPWAITSARSEGLHTGAQASFAPPPQSRFELTVDSIRRPNLVGWTPAALRWSADSRHLYFDWRKPGAKKKSSTFVVGRDGGTPRKLTDQEKEKVPPADGRWDKAHQRVLFVDDGDVVMV